MNNESTIQQNSWDTSKQSLKKEVKKKKMEIDQKSKMNKNNQKLKKQKTKDLTIKARASPLKL